jgi:hypothetical protein
MYSCYKLTDSSRSMLLSRFPPKFEKVIAHHITLRFGVPAGEPLPDTPKSCRVIGYSANEKIECLVVEVNGTTVRPDGKIFHITLSLDPSKAKPVDSNTLLQELGWHPLDIAVKIDAKPSIEK